MIISPSLVRGSERRARRSGLTTAALAALHAEGPRRATADQKEGRYQSVLAQTGSAVAARSALERLIGGNDLVGINYLELGTRCARSVCRIRLRGPGGATVGFGTGFLVAPGVLMTNHHVIPGPEDARGALAEFDYENDP